jgi:hypothetical protein
MFDEIGVLMRGENELVTTNYFCACCSKTFEVNHDPKRKSKTGSKGTEEIPELDE